MASMGVGSPLNAPTSKCQPCPASAGLFVGDPGAPRRYAAGAIADRARQRGPRVLDPSAARVEDDVGGSAGAVGPVQDLRSVHWAFRPRVGDCGRESGGRSERKPIPEVVAVEVIASEVVVVVVDVVVPPPEMAPVVRVFEVRLIRNSPRP